MYRPITKESETIALLTFVGTNTQTIGEGSRSHFSVAFCGFIVD